MTIKVWFTDTNINKDLEYLHKVLYSESREELFDLVIDYFKKNHKLALELNEGRVVVGDWEILDWSGSCQKTEFHLKLHRTLVGLDL
jgi:hypothetical protein